jgi:hypothetical protein
MEIGFDVAHFAIERVLGVDAVFNYFALLEDGLRFFLVLPEICVADFFFDYGQLLASGWGVKDSSARAPCAF